MQFSYDQQITRTTDGKLHYLWASKTPEHTTADRPLDTIYILRTLENIHVNAEVCNICELW